MNTCGNCKYWIDENADGMVSILGEDAGRCRRYPPVLDVSMVRPYPHQSEKAGEDAAQWTQTLSYQSDWCGEWGAIDLLNIDS